MSDVVVTIPQTLWYSWLIEGDLPGEPWDGSSEYHYWYSGGRPRIEPGERVYCVAWNRLRGYAPLIRVESHSLVRGGGAVAVTIPTAIPGFRGWRYRWWYRADEMPFPDWQTAGVGQ